MCVCVCVYIIHLLYPFFCLWTFKLLSCAAMNTEMHESS